MLMSNSVDISADADNESPLDLSVQIIESSSKKRRLDDISPEPPSNESKRTRALGCSDEQLSRIHSQSSMFDNTNATFTESELPRMEAQGIYSTYDSPARMSNSAALNNNSNNSLDSIENANSANIPISDNSFETPDEEPLSSTQISPEDEVSSCENIEPSSSNISMTALQIDESDGYIFFPPVDGKYARNLFHRNILPLVRANARKLSSLIRKHRASEKDKDSVVLSKNVFVKKTSIRHMMDFLGSPITAELLIRDPNSLIFKENSISTLDDLESWKNLGKDKNRALREAITKISKELPATVGRKMEQPSKDLWLAAIHYLASSGAALLARFESLGQEEILKYANARDQNLEAANLSYTVRAFSQLIQVYKSARRCSELFFVDATQIVHWVPLCKSKLMYNLIVNKIFKAKHPNKDGYKSINLLVEYRLRDIGVYIHKSHVTNAADHGKKILGVSSHFSCEPMHRPLIGIAKKVKFGVSSFDKKKKIMALLGSIVMMESRVEAEDVPNELENPSEKTKKIIDAFYNESMKKRDFLENFIKKPLSFGPHGCFNNRVFRPPVGAKDRNSSSSKKNSTIQQRSLKGKNNLPGWAKDPGRLIPSYYQRKIKLNLSKYRIMDGKRADSPQSKKSRTGKPVQPNLKSKKPPTTLEGCLVEANKLRKKGKISFSDFKVLKTKISSLSIAADDADIPAIKNLCNIINELQIKTVSPGLKILSCNMGRVSDSDRIRHLVSMFSDVSIFCIAEVMWDRNEVLRKCNWPQNFSIATHDKLGSASKSYSMIIWNNSDIPDLKVMPSVGTFTVVKFKGPAKTNIVAVGYRFCDRREKCWFNKHLGAKPMIFCDWLQELADLYDKPSINAFVTGDFNFEDVPRTADPKEICEKARYILRNFTNVITKKTFYRPGGRASSIDKLHCTNPENTKVRYLRLNQAPFGYDGHCGFIFSVNAIPIPIPYEPFIVTKLGSRKEIFEEGMKLPMNPTHTDFSFCFNAMTNVLDAVSTKTIRFKQNSKRSKFNYSRATWNLINMINDFKDCLSENQLAMSYTKKTLSWLGFKVKKLKKVDEMAYRKLVSKEVDRDSNVIWQLLNEVTNPPPVEKLDFDEEVLLDKVKKLQSDTVTHSRPYDGTGVNLICTKKLSKIDFLFAKSTDSLPALYPEFLKLQGHTKGSSGISKNFLDLLPAHFVTEYIFFPLLMAARSGSYPAELRTSRVQCLAKGKGQIRPISINEPLASILEKLTVFFLTNYIELNELMPELQSGFRVGLGCDTSLFQVVNAVSRAYDKGQCSMLLLFDCKNAFGTTPHISIMRMLGHFTEGPFFNFLGESLIRKAKVVKNGFSSQVSTLLPFGIPQGGVLAPIIFSLYVSQLKNCLGSLPMGTKMSLFADDQATVICAKNHDELLRKARDAVSVICKLVDDLGMTLVGYKTQITVFGKQYVNRGLDTLERISVAGDIIDYSSVLKYLGTLISSEKGCLSFARNTDMIIGKSKGIVQRLRGLRPFVYEKENAMLLRSILLGLVQHNFAVLPPMTNANLKRLQLIFHAGLRSTKASAWWFKTLTAEQDDRALQSEHVAELLCKFGMPSIYLIKLALFAKSISKSLISKRSAAQRNTLMAALKIYSASTHKVLFPVPDILLIKRREDKLKKINAIFGEKIPALNIMPITELIIDIITRLLDQNILEIRLMKHRSKKTAESKLCWPWHMQNEFNELPAFVRNSVIHKDFNNKLRTFLEQQHAHLAPTLSCSNCKHDSLCIPISVQCDIERIDDSLAYRDLVAFEKSEEKINKESNAVHSIILQCYHDKVEEGNTLPQDLCNLIDKIRKGRVFSVGTLLQELFRIADFDNHFNLDRSIFV
ncbi:unnamed protein product [Oikopleura dioica]|uniref:Reverse transcriptase domain-containing protein n=1 Tax=Oikopleura dioica TaxID=34765 RepID=E4X180_OIKDI|nr:unnamed protein product [Oikopleura dioica]